MWIRLLLAEASGLDKQEALKLLMIKVHMQMMLELMKIAQQYQISGVPYFIINQKYAISGAQPLETLLVHFSKCGKKRILYLSYKSFLQKVEAICLVQMKAVRSFKRTIVFMMESNP